MSSVAIMQPTYLPWLGYFDLIAKVDKFVFLDNVQVVRKTANSFDCRNRIKTPQGEHFLVCPVMNLKLAKQETLFTTTFPDDRQDWRTKHLRSLEMNYRKAPYFSAVYDLLAPAIQQKYESIADLNIRLIRLISAAIGYSPEFFRASEMPAVAGEKDARLVNMCRQLGADFYLSPKGAHVYIEAEQSSGAFANTGITLKYQDYHPQSYPQMYGEFIPYLSVVDVLFNVGFEQSAAIIASGSRAFLSSSDFKH